MRLEMSDIPPTPAAEPPTAFDIIPDILTHTFQHFIPHSTSYSPYPAPLNHGAESRWSVELTLSGIH